MAPPTQPGASGDVKRIVGASTGNRIEIEGTRNCRISLARRMAINESYTPNVFWLLGLSGAGKSTLAAILIQYLRARGIPVLSLDGDVLRGGLCTGLGFSDMDRAENLRRAAEVAKLALQSQLNVVASFITPLEAHRKLIREVLPAGQPSFIWVKASLATCQARDVKGLYARARTGGIPQMTGLGGGFEVPISPATVIATESLSPEESGRRLCTYVRDRIGLSQ